MPALNFGNDKLLAALYLADLPTLDLALLSFSFCQKQGVTNTKPPNRVREIDVVSQKIIFSGRVTGQVTALIYCRLYDIAALVVCIMLTTGKDYSQRQYEKAPDKGF
jgi:hypothetical protein